MSDFVTPRKRKAGGAAVPISGSSGRKRAPAPNPPVLPFPTPPRTGHRSRPSLSDSSSFYDAVPEPTLDDHSRSSKGGASRTQLPAHLQTLLTLHRAFNVALSLHIATHPPVLPPHSPSATNVKLPNLTNLLALRETIERTGGRRFGVAELQRLAWVWTWDGRDPDARNPPADGDDREAGVTDLDIGTGAAQKKEEENPFLVPSSPAQCPTLEVSGLDYLITPTRTLDPVTGRRVYTYGIGIDLQLRQGETRQMLHGGSEGGLGNKGQGGGMGAVGRWNVAGGDREEIVRDRLERWVGMHGGFEELDTVRIENGLPTPPSTKTSDVPRSAIPPIPLLPLPHLPSSTLLPSANLFGGSPSPARLGPGLTGLSSLNVTPVKTPNSASGLSDPFILKDSNSAAFSTPIKAEGQGEESGSATKSGGKAGLEARRQAMMDRIKARKSQKGGVPTLGAALTDTNSPRMGLGLNKADTQEELKRRSTLSRLEGVAEAVWMLFSAPAQSTTSVTLTPPRGRRKAVPMVEAAEVIVKSSKTPISIAEAQASLTLLTQLCPFFLQLKLIGRSEWLEMPPQVAAAVPSSPGQSMLGSAASILPRHSHLPIPPRSPRTVSGSSTGVAAQGGQGGVPRTPTTPRTPGRAGLRALQDELEADDPDAEASAKGSMTLTPGRGAGTYAHVSDTHHLALSPLRARTTPRSSMPSPSPGRAARIAAMELGGVSPASAHAMAALGDDAGLESVLGAGGLGLGGVGAGIGAGAMAGPASPGRVRRVGGLREVRERIRRELGE